MKLLGSLFALMLAVAVHGQGTGNPGGGGGMNFVAPVTTNAVVATAMSQASNSFIWITGGTGTNTTLQYPSSVGLTNTGGFFLGGTGQIGTNGSQSILTVNMVPVFNGSSFTNVNGGFFGGNTTFGTNGSASALTVNMGSTFNSTITAANASGTAASSIANVGTLDARYGIMTYHGPANGTASSNSGVAYNSFNGSGQSILIGSPTAKLLGFSVCIIPGGSQALSNGWVVGPTLMVDQSNFSTNNTNLAPGSGSDMSANFKVFAAMSITNLPTVSAGSTFSTNITFSSPVSGPVDCPAGIIIRCFSIQPSQPNAVSNLQGTITARWKP